MGSRVSILFHYNVVDQILGHLEAHWQDYAELRIIPRADVSLRGQIGGQMYRLSPESLERILNVLHAEREKQIPSAKQPANTLLETLVRGRPYLWPAPAKPGVPRRGFFFPRTALRRPA